VVDVDDDLATAFHEAGHAVAAYVLGRAIVLATIRRGPQERPRVSITDVQPNQRTRRERAIIVAIAGGLAEAKYRGGTLKKGVVVADMAYARDEIRALAEEGGLVVTEELVTTHGRELALSAKRIVETYWQGIEALAAALKSRGRLNGPEIRRLLREVIGEQPRVQHAYGGQLVIRPPV
jgi:hypothetical protein